MPCCHPVCCRIWLRLADNHDPRRALRIWLNSQDLFPSPCPACCRYTKVQPYMQQNPDQNGELMDIEDLNRLGRVRGPCPFYLSREMAATANIVFMPYNYLVDPKIRGGLATQWANAVLIFDEAHNIEVRFRALPPGSHSILQTASLSADILHLASFGLHGSCLTSALHGTI